jgi:hypothetical protein
VILLEELAACVQVPEKEFGKTEHNLIKTILYLFKNSLIYHNFQQEDRKTITQLFLKYSQDSGFFSALVYLSQKFHEGTQDFCYLLLEISYLVISRFEPRQVYFTQDNLEVIKQLKFL